MGPWILIILIVIAFAVVLAAAGRDKADYDERQRQVQLRAYRAAFWVFLAFVLGFGLIELFVGEILETLSVALAGMILSLTLHALICICGDAYLKLKASRPRFLALTTLILLLYLCNVLFFQDGPWLHGDQFSGRSIYLLTAGHFLVVDVAYFARYLYDRRGGCE